MGQKYAPSGNDHSRCDIQRVITSITMSFNDEKTARIIYFALLPEAKKPPTHRSTARISVDDNILKIEIFSKDLVSLRAALNSYFRWLYTLIASIEVIENVSK